MPYAPKKATAKKVVVKQATINKIKDMGMTASLKKAAKSSNTEFVEGVRRMYGQRRIDAAVRARPAAKSADAARASAMRPKKAPVAKSADEARARAMASAPKAKPKASGKGLFPGLLTGNYQSKKITRGKVSGPGYFKK